MKPLLSRALCPGTSDERGTPHDERVGAVVLSKGGPRPLTFTTRRLGSE